MIQAAIDTIKSSLGSGKYTLQELAIIFRVDEYLLGNVLASLGINPTETIVNDAYYDVYDLGDLSASDQTEVSGPDTAQVYYDIYKCRQYIKKGRWYGPQTTYGQGYYNSNYNYGSDDYDEVPTLDYQATGSRPSRSGRLKGICIVFNRANDDIENLHILVNKQTKTYGSETVVNSIIHHDNTSSSGHAILEDKPYLINLTFDEPVELTDIITVLMNSSDSSNGNKYLYGTEIKFIYE